MIGLVLGLITVVVLVVVAALSVAFAIYQSSRKRIGYIPLPERAVREVTKALDSTGRTTLFDLGCGDGRVLTAVLWAQPGASGVGIELNPAVAWLARWRLRSFDPGRIRVVRDNLLNQDLSSATHLFAYLNVPTMALLEPKLQRELGPGARLVSCDFPLPTRKPTTTVTIGKAGQLGRTLYIYDYS